MRLPTYVLLYVPLGATLLLVHRPAELYPAPGGRMPVFGYAIFQPPLVYLGMAVLSWFALDELLRVLAGRPGAWKATVRAFIGGSAAALAALAVFWVAAGRASYDGLESERPQVVTMLILAAVTVVGMTLAAVSVSRWRWGRTLALVAPVAATLCLLTHAAYLTARWGEWVGTRRLYPNLALAAGGLAVIGVGQLLLARVERRVLGTRERTDALVFALLWAQVGVTAGGLVYAFHMGIVFSPGERWVENPERVCVSALAVVWFAALVVRLVIGRRYWLARHRRGRGGA